MTDRSPIDDLEQVLTLAAAKAVVYRKTASERPVHPMSGFDACLSAFDEPLPEFGIAPAAAIEELVTKAEPGLMTMTSPRFLGWVTGASHPAGVAADWLTSAWGQSALYAEPTPAAAAAEQVACGWVLDLLDLPRDAGVGITTGATMANFSALCAARHALLARVGWDVEADGLFGAPEVTVVVGGEVHASVFLSLRLLGFGARRVLSVEADDQGRMIPEALGRTLSGVRGPVIVCLQAGNVNSGAFDPFDALIPLAHEIGAWVHVDGAFGLWARAAPSLAALTQGLDAADSWAADGHKWLQVPYDCGIAVVRDAAALGRAMNVSAAYLAESAHRDPSSFTPEMSRRAKGFPLWAVIRTLGRKGVAEMVARHCAVARAIAESLDTVDGLQVLNDVVLNQVVLAAGPKGAEGDRLTQRLLQKVQTAGVAYPSHGYWHGRSIIRVSVSSGPCTLKDGQMTAQTIEEVWNGMRQTA